MFVVPLFQRIWGVIAGDNAEAYDLRVLMRGVERNVDVAMTPIEDAHQYADEVERGDLSFACDGALKQVVEGTAMAGAFVVAMKTKPDLDLSIRILRFLDEMNDAVTDAVTYSNGGGKFEDVNRKASDFMFLRTAMISQIIDVLHAEYTRDEARFFRLIKEEDISDVLCLRLLSFMAQRQNDVPADLTM